MARLTGTADFHLVWSAPVWLVGATCSPRQSSGFLKHFARSRRGSALFAGNSSSDMPNAVSIDCTV